MTDEIDDETREVILKVEKILRLAAKNPNPEEAASATAIAMKLLAAHNLDQAAIAEHGEEAGGQRKAEALNGGQREWEQDLWKAVAELNFCMYWHQTDFVETKLGRFKDYRRGKVVRGIYVHRHNVVGRKVNIAGTNAMASYLQGAVERLTRERCVPAKIGLGSKFAQSFRDGLTFGVVSAIHLRRKEQISEERQRAREAEERAAEAATAGASTSTAITLSTFRKSEEEANIDFRYGAGTSAKWAAERAERARLSKEADDRYTAWAAANPKEAAKEARREAKERQKQANRRQPSYRGDASAWVDGNQRAKDISLDLQTGDSGASTRKRLT